VGPGLISEDLPEALPRVYERLFKLAESVSFKPVEERRSGR
jgi:hypothetical protein